MPDLTLTDAEVDNASTLEAETLAALIKSVGPKEVRTPNMTVVAHDIAAVQRVMERRAITTVPTMCSLRGCIGVPKKSSYDTFHNLSCGCNASTGCSCG